MSHIAAISAVIMAAAARLMRSMLNIAGSRWRGIENPLRRRCFHIVPRRCHASVLFSVTATGLLKDAEEEGLLGVRRPFFLTTPQRLRQYLYYKEAMRLSMDMQIKALGIKFEQMMGVRVSELTLRNKF